MPLVVGAYHHVDHREKRFNQIQNEQRRAAAVDDFVVDPSHFSPRSPSSHRERNALTMAKAVHYRCESEVFTVDDVNISFRFRHDRVRLRQIDSLWNDQTEPQSVLVLCSTKMKSIYQQFDSLFHSFERRNVSVTYATFDDLQPILLRSRSVPNSESQGVTPMSIVSASLNVSPSVQSRRNEKKSNEKLSEIEPIDALDEARRLMDILSIPNATSDPEESIGTFLREMKLVLILMKTFDESFFTDVNPSSSHID